MKKKVRTCPTIRSLADLISQMKERGAKTAFRFPEGKSFSSLSYADFADKVLAIAAGLTQKGLAGKRIAIIGETSPEWVAAYLGVIVAGGVAVPMDKELAIREIEGFLSGIDAEAIVYSAAFHDKFAPARESHPTLKTFIPFTQPTGEIQDERVLPLPELMVAGNTAVAAGYPAPERNPEDLAVMLFTSGTTGTSKCVMLCEKNVCAATNSACATVDFSDADTTLSVLPLHHTYELTIMLASLTLGVTISINDSLRHLSRNLREFRPTRMILVPLFVNALYKKIWDEAKKQKKEGKLRRALAFSEFLRHLGIDLRKKLFSGVLSAFGGRLCMIISGGAPLNVKMIKGFDALGIQICEGYGITECSPLISVNPYFAPKPGSVGPAVPSCRTRIAPSGEKAGNGYDLGEIQVKGDNVMLGYYHNDEENQKAFTEDGWYRTGDIGYMDKDGYIFITGRMKSVIVLENGKNVFPEEIEEYLAGIPEIGEAVVVGRKGEDGETVLLTAIVYPNPEFFPEGSDREAAYSLIFGKINELNRSLPSFKKIKALELRETEFEKTTSKKIKRQLVK